MHSLKFYYSILMLGGASVYALPHEKPEHIFTTIFEHNTWGDPESVSGDGSTFQATDLIRKSLPALIKNYSIQSVLDIPCGDFNWLKKVDLGTCFYIGMDIVEPLINKNNNQYARPLRIFKQGDALTTRLPKVDLILCRDLFCHFDFDSIFAALRNFKRSGSQYLLVTVQQYVEYNGDIPMGEWRPLDFQKTPFNFPAPRCLLSDRERVQDVEGTTKYLGLWLLDELPL
ncbi:class I SAM-dependent methyltransferase [Candidatus Dependentiae bacterium]|nr:class I SAM-dependent methyltransferase [Candidatus Dependentiae bacterium]